MKTILKVLLCITMCFSIFTVHIHADELIEQADEETEFTIGEAGGYLTAHGITISKMFRQRTFNYPYGGHGFAAEEANTLYDNLSGTFGKVIGYTNETAGPDRMIINRNGSITYIQDKYYRKAADSVDAAFDTVTGKYKYTVDGKPQVLEVAYEQYDEAVERMAKKIKEGLVDGVTDPDEAKNLVKQGPLTHDQAARIAKAGNIDSLKFDAVNGIITATTALGISFVMDYIACRLNGDDNKSAIISAGKAGLMTGTTAFTSYVIIAQLSRTGAASVFMPAAEAISKSLGKNTLEALTDMLATAGTKATPAAVSKLISSAMLNDAVIVAVMSIPEVIEVFNNRISPDEFLRNITVVVCTAAGATVGGVAGGPVGYMVVPGLGSKIGGFVGGVLGSMTAGFISQYAMEQLFETDAEQMYEILTTEFQKLGESYLITETEASNICNSLSQVLDDNTLKDMYASKDRTTFANELLVPLFEEEVSKRDTIQIPDIKPVRREMKEQMKGVVLIH